MSKNPAAPQPVEEIQRGKPRKLRNGRSYETGKIPYFFPLVVLDFPEFDKPARREQNRISAHSKFHIFYFYFSIQFSPIYLFLSLNSH